VRVILLPGWGTKECRAATPPHDWPELPPSCPSSPSSSSASSASSMRRFTSMPPSLPARGEADRKSVCVCVCVLGGGGGLSPPDAESGGRRWLPQGPG
jgi:hypothetical protein